MELSKLNKKTLKPNIIDFFNKVNYDFQPILSSQVNIDDYVTKLLDNACLFVKQDSNNFLQGLIALYCNDFKTKTSYIPFVAVLESERGKGIATELLTEAINYSQTKGFTLIRLKVSNPIAKKMYEKFGFREISFENEKFLMELKK